MSDLEKVVEKIPYMDGATRRRITAGVIFSAATFYSISIGFNLHLDFTLSTEISFTTGILSILILYAVANLIEILSDIIFSKLLFDRRGVTPYLSESGKNYLESLPPTILESITNPYKKKGELAWLYFCERGTNPEKHLARKLSSRLKDSFTIISAITFSIFVATYPFFLDNQTKLVQVQSQLVGMDAALGLIRIVSYYIVFAFPLCFLFAYAWIRKASLIKLIEFNAINVKCSDHVVKCEESRS